MSILVHAPGPARIRPLPCPTKLRFLVRYDPDTGRLFWRARGAWVSKASKNNQTPQCCVRRFNARYVGRDAFASVGKNGYLHGPVNGVYLAAHRVAWCVFYGAWPDRLVDHINGIRTDNRVANLRLATVRENSRNRVHEPANGYYGVVKLAYADRWMARIRHEGREVYLGCFASHLDAVRARVLAEERYWGRSQIARFPQLQRML